MQGSLFTGYVDGDMSTFLREKEIAKLERNNLYDCSILSNAKCLSEGVDIPTLDGIVFVDPRESEIDIIQAVGRAIRKSNNKTKGTIILPVFIENDENSKDEIKKSDFKKIWKVINALKAHDYKLGEVLTGFRSTLGRIREKYISESIPKFIFDLPEDIDDSFERSLQTRLIEVTSESWYYWYGLLQNYIENKGTAVVPAKYKQLPYKLGSWVMRQRVDYNNGILSKERIDKLEIYKNKGWIWDTLDALWKEKYKLLQGYVEREGTARVPRDYKDGDTALGTWVDTQIMMHKKGNLSEERIDELEKFKNKGWVWERGDAVWQETYELFQKYIERESTAIVPRKHIERDISLGFWVTVQRRKYRKGTLHQDKIDKLEKYIDKGWYWGNFKHRRWKEKYKLLQVYVEREGTARVHRNYKDGDFALGAWVDTQRMMYKKGTLSEERIDELEKFKNKGWVWKGDA